MMRWIGFVAVLMVGIMRMAEALYSGNPDEPDLIDNGLFLQPDSWFAFKVGYQGDYVFNRRLHAGSSIKENVDEFQYRMNQGVLTINMMDRLEIFGSVGAMQAEIQVRPQDDGRMREFQTNGNTTWGAGGRLLMFTWGKVHLGATGSYQSANLPVRWDSLDGETFSSSAKLYYREWQVAALISYRVEMLVPYIGAVYSTVKANMKHLNSNMEIKHNEFLMRSRERIGIALGCSLTSSTIVDLNVEVRLFDEEAISLAGNIRF